MTLAPISHSVGVEQLDSKVEAAHLAVLLHVSDQFVLQTVWIISLQRTCWVVRRRRKRLLYYIDRSVTKRYVAPITELLIRLDFLVHLKLHQRKRPCYSQ